MSLKPVLDSLDQVDESLRPHYTSNSDGKFILTLDGQLPNYVDQVTHNEQLNKVTEFRNNNIQLLEERDGLKQLAEKAQAFGAITPEEAHAAIQQRQELESKGVKKSSDVQAVVDAALARFKDTEFKAVQAQLTATNEARKAAEQQVTEQQMTASIGQVFKAAGGQDGAEAFIVSRARDKFRRESYRQRQDSTVLKNRGSHYRLRSGWLPKRRKSGLHLVAVVGQAPHRMREPCTRRCQQV